MQQRLRINHQRSRRKRFKASGLSQRKHDTPASSKIAVKANAHMYTIVPRWSCMKFYRWTSTPRDVKTQPLSVLRVKWRPLARVPKRRHQSRPYREAHLAIRQGWHPRCLDFVQSFLLPKPSSQVGIWKRSERTMNTWLSLLHVRSPHERTPSRFVSAGLLTS